MKILKKHFNHSLLSKLFHYFHKKRIQKLLDIQNGIYLELGGVEKRNSTGWITIDLDEQANIQWDLRKGIPLPNETAQAIYSSHLLEHFSFKECQKLLDECHRVLKDDGKISVCVPDARIYISAYLNAVNLHESRDFFQYKAAYNNTTRIDYVNHVAYMNGHHKYMFDKENLLYILKQRGFSNVCLRNFDPSLDSESRHYESIYAEGYKKVL